MVNILVKAGADVNQAGTKVCEGYCKCPAIETLNFTTSYHDIRIAMHATLFFPERFLVYYSCLMILVLSEIHIIINQILNKPSLIFKAQPLTVVVTQDTETDLTWLFHATV